MTVTAIVIAIVSLEGNACSLAPDEERAERDVHARGSSAPGRVGLAHVSPNFIAMRLLLVEYHRMIRRLAFEPFFRSAEARMPGAVLEYRQAPADATSPASSRVAT